MKLVKDVVRVNSEIDEIELHALISTPGELSQPIIKDDEDVALILLEQRNVPTVYVSIKGRQTNVMSREEVEQHGNQLNQNEIYNASHIPQHSIRNPQQWQFRYAQESVQPECVMPLSNENTTLEDNTVSLEGDTTTLEDNIAFDEGNEDLFAADEDRFDDNSDDGLEQWHDDSLNDDWLYDSDIPICNNVEGEMEPVRGVDVGDVQCDDPIYNNPIVGENKIRSLNTLLDDSYQERGNARISRMWLIVVLKEKFAIRVKRSCKGRYEVGCKDKACKFNVRATKLPDREEYWQVRTFHKVHTCTIDGLQGRYPTTSVKIIGELMSHKLRANGLALRPMDIICEMRVQWGLECLESEGIEFIVFFSKCKREAIEFYADYYKTTVLVEGCSGSIRSIGHPSEWAIPPYVRQIVVLPTPWRGQAGKPKRRRIPSAGEGIPSTNPTPSPSQSMPPQVCKPKACSSCKQTDHTRNNCPIRRTMFENVSLVGCHGRGQLW
ncbi:Uncharacterized protein TCM_040682 [Theobroma cacao]|uniref:Uncharacterized protein n=1 Tax=Theobroma cacao TaxID=3641 RepID=A0A061GU54_THECC|nr:Uncharacterized protein TCM_040682 [Theobroma cacao]